MAKLRRNHSGSRGKSFMGRAVTTTVGLIGFIIWGFFQFGPSIIGEQQTTTGSSSAPRGYVPINTEQRDYLPIGDDGEVVHHNYYSLSYNEKYEVPNWVAYKLTEESLKVKNVPRAKRFKSDPAVNDRSAKHSDYSHSGYTRGHMAPAGDMAFSADAMQESFYMSNMTPQTKGFNSGIWRELEENVRDWAYDNDELYIVSGPLFHQSNPQQIGKSSKIAVPDAFFKAVLDIKGNKQKSIGFIIPHETLGDHLRTYAVTIDEIERVTGLDLYANLIADDNEEERLEQEMDVNRWQFNKKRFNQRVKVWNKAK